MSDVPAGEQADLAAEAQSGGSNAYAAAAGGQSQTADIPGAAGSQSGFTQQDTAIPQLPTTLGSARVVLGSAASAGTGKKLPAGDNTESTAQAQPELTNLFALVTIFDFLDGAQATAPQQPGGQSSGRGLAVRNYPGTQQGTPIQGNQSSQLATGYDTVDMKVLQDLAKTANMDPQGLAQQWMSGQLSSVTLTNLRNATNVQLTAALKSFGVKLPASATGLNRNSVFAALNTAMPATERQQLQEEGYSVTGSTLGDFIASVGQRGQATNVLAAASGATSGAITAAEAYQQFVKNYETDSNGFDNKIKSRLGLAGTINSDAASNTQVYQAYQSVLQYAVEHNVTVNDAFDKLAQQNSPPGEQTTTQEGEIGAYIRQQATLYGVDLSPNQLNNLIYQAQANGWTEDDNEEEIQRLVASNYTFNPQQLQAGGGGYAQVVYNTIKGIAAQYGIPFTNALAGNYITNLIKGTGQQGGQPFSTSYEAGNLATAGFTEIAKNQAMSLYPTLTPGIQAGNTVQQMFQPYADLAQDLLGVDASNINLVNNPLYNQIIDQTDDKGNRSMMTLDQAKKYMMQNPAFGFQHTQGAMDMASSLANAIGETFGKTAAPEGFSYSNSIPASAYGA